MNKTKVMSTFGIEPSQKKAMFLIQKEVGISQTTQVEMALNLYLLTEHGDTLKKYKFKTDEYGKLQAPKN